MKSGIVKRSVVVRGHKTSVSLEDAFWRGVKDVARASHLQLSELIAAIDTGRAAGNLSSALRLFVLDHYRAEASRHQTERMASPQTFAPRAADPLVNLGQEGS